MISFYNISSGSTCGIYPDSTELIGNGHYSEYVLKQNIYFLYLSIFWTMLLRWTDCMSQCCLWLKEHTDECINIHIFIVHCHLNNISISWDYTINTLSLHVWLLCDKMLWNGIFCATSLISYSVCVSAGWRPALTPQRSTDGGLNVSLHQGLLWEVKISLHKHYSPAKCTALCKLL